MRYNGEGGLLGWQESKRRKWRRTLPVAPESRPTLAEFADPIAYILKIEPEASRYGICKIVPPLPSPPREATVQLLKASFASNAAASASGDAGPTFPTRLQQVGLSTKNRRGANRRVWESGERYTLEAFRTKARDFELPRHAIPPKHATPLQLEALFWGACAARPFSVEYGNDMPGSGFVKREVLDLDTDSPVAAPRDVGETEWNMRVAPRARGSLLRGMSRDVAGVTTPMLYVAMLYSWFAWHVEDHELHSLNYLHFGKPKTWYGVPRDAMLAFEDAVRVHGYADDLNAIREDTRATKARMGALGFESKESRTSWIDIEEKKFGEGAEESSMTSTCDQTSLNAFQI
ncbi:Lysine-specific demethylase 5D [Triticum urartu]|uniref:Lysine-specific demethylase 5D n=1 Tax=Triticum urartu TaxID=4572 RepID=M7YI74_TRIUA|nr:Lysine-specific demethylase 5D [Triticum urartu]